MLHGKYFCLMTGVGGNQGHAPWKVLLSYDWCWGEARACSIQNTFVLKLVLGVSKGMLNGKYFCLMTGVGGKQGHAPWKVLLSYDWC